MKLTKEQIQELFLFTQKKWVHYYDLQIEIVDHLAEKIELLLVENPSLDFKQALQKVYQGFGIFGFANIVREKEQQSVRYGKKLFRRELIALFKLPQILFILFLSVFVWQMTQWIPLEILYPVFLAAWAMVSIWQMYVNIKNNKRQKKKLLMMYFQPQSFIPFLWVEYMFLANELPDTSVFYFIVMLVVIFKIASQKVYTNIRTQAIREYPDAFA